MGKIIRLLFPLLCLAATASAIGGDLAAGHEPSFPSQGVLFVTPLLSEAEEVEYRARIRTAKDQSERERIRATHYDLMRTRAKERGYDLPATRPAATGVTGEEFGPKLLGEEERAAQRAKLRAARIEASAAGPAPARPEPVVQLAKPVNAATVAETGKSKAEGVAVPSSRTPAPLPASVPAPAASAQSAAATGAKAAPAAEGRPAALLLPGLDTIFGQQLMSEEEKAAFRARLRRAKTDEERAAIRAERDRQIDLRAKEKGVNLPR